MTNPTTGSGNIQAPLPLSQAALEALPFPFAICTCDGLYVAANDLVEQLFRVPKAALVGSFNFLSDPVSQDNGTRAVFQAAVAGQRGEAPPTYYDFSFPGTRNHDRTGCWIASTFLPFRDATGQVTHVGMLIQDVSERVETEQKTTRLIALVENAQDAMGTMDLEGRITYCNQAYLALTGYGDELMGKPITSIFADDDEVVTGTIRQVVVQGHWRGQLLARRADGTNFPAEVSAFPLRDLAGQMTGMAATIRDLTEWQAQEQHLRTFEMLVEHAPIGLALADSDGRFLYVNPACAAYYGYTDGLVGKHYLELIAPVELERLAPYLPEGNTAGSWEGRTLHQRHDGSTFPVYVASVALLANDGSPCGSAAITRDLTAEVEAESLLRRFQLLVENAPDGFTYTDLEGRLIYLNPAFRAMLGYAETPVGAPLLQFFATHEHARIAQEMPGLMTQGSWQDSISYQRADGSIFDGQLTAFVIRDATGTPQGIAGIMRDLSDAQRAEAERAALQEQLIQAQQSALRELSTPLIPIADGVVAMPLIGSIDSSRAQVVVETLLGGVAELRAHTTIIDITGVPVVDTQVANALLRAAQAVQLLGAQVILTGIRPEVAQTLVGLGINLSGISTRGTLQSGIAEALRRNKVSVSTIA